MHQGGATEENKKGEENMKKTKQITQEQQQQTRRSSRFVGQHMTIAEKAEELTRKRNLEGTNLYSKNSFAVLSDEEIIDKTSKMGVNWDVNDMEVINVIKDLEIARHTLEKKRDEKSNVTDENEEVVSPSVEQQLLGWHSESSDEEEFTLVTSKRSRKKKKKVTFCESQNKCINSPHGNNEKKKEDPKISSRVNLGKGNKAKKSK